MIFDRTWLKMSFKQDLHQFQIVKVGIQVEVLKKGTNIWMMYGDWSLTATQNLIKYICFKNCSKVIQKCMQIDKYTQNLKTHIDAVMTMVRLMISLILLILVGVEEIVTVQERYHDSPLETVS